MKRALPYLVLLLILPSSGAFAETICTNNVDSKGNVCTNFTTKPHSYNPYQQQPTFLIDYEDGKPDPSDFTGAVILNEPSPQPGQLDIPFDPLIIEGLVPDFGTTASILNGYYTSLLVGGRYCSRKPCASQTYTIQYVFSDLIPGRTEYPYAWHGTFIVTYTIQGYSCRYGVCSPYYSTGPGTGELSAVHD